MGEAGRAELELVGVDQVLVDQGTDMGQVAEAGQLETAFLLATPDPVAVYLASLGFGRIAAHDDWQPGPARGAVDWPSRYGGD